MAYQPLSTALSRALALRLNPDSSLLGSGLNLTVSPTASASSRLVLPGIQTIGSQATALGLGFGSSRFLADPENAAFFSSGGGPVVSGGGLIRGSATAHAATSGQNPASSEATAVNIGLGRLDFISRGGGPLRIGTGSEPFAATATAAGRSLLAPETATRLNAQLTAIARVRGLEGEPGADALPAAAIPTVHGQSDNTVRATAVLDADPGPTATAGRAVADARGIEGYRVMALSEPAVTAIVGGDATAVLKLLTAPAPISSSLDLAATAIGIDQALLRGPSVGAVVFRGAGLATLSLPAAFTPQSTQLRSLQGIGISTSTVESNGADTQVLGQGGFAAPGSGGFQPGMDAAGIDRSTILTGSGGDVVIGRIVRETDRGVDANGDGIVSPGVFLDASALQGGEGGFEGIRNSVINTGAGDDLVGIGQREEAPIPGSSASASRIDTGSGNDILLLDRARNSILDGGSGDDVVVVSGVAHDNRLQGGFGDDLVGVAAGDGNRLDGGYGHDQVIGGTGRNTFLQSNAGAALDAAGPDSALGSAGRASGPGPTDPAFAERLTDPGFWSPLSEEKKQTLWNEGTWREGDLSWREDRFANFDAARGDVLELSSSLGSISQTLWDSQGALLGVQGGALLVRDGTPGSQLGVVVGTLQEIRSLGIGSPSLAYATDSRQLMFDADGDWRSGGGLSLGSVSMVDPSALSKASFRFGSGA